MSMNMNGKICLVTGADSGLGKVTALEIAKMGATVVMLCLNLNEGEETLTEIKQKSENDSVDLMICDLSSMDSVRKLATDFKAKYKKLHVLINNAGVQLGERTLSVDGYEYTFATNFLGHFLLTNLLLDVIKASVPGRIINVSSLAHRLGKINFDDLHFENRKYDEYPAYCQSKLAIILSTYEWARRLEETGITVNCLHPGIVRTNIMRHSKYGQKSFDLAGDLLLTPEQGAKTTIYLATSPEVENITGKYFDNKKEVKSSKKSYDRNLQKKLWGVSEKLTGLEGSNFK